MRHRLDPRQMSALAVVGIGAYALKRLSQVDHGADALFANAPHVRRHANLARIFKRFAALAPPNSVDRAVQAAQVLLQLSGGLAADQDPEQRLLEVRSLCTFLKDEVERSVKGSRRTERHMEARVDFAQDDMPIFESILESVLHNAILDASRH